jgi:hypothetical protein
LLTLSRRLNETGKRRNYYKRKFIAKGKNLLEFSLENPKKNFSTNLVGNQGLHHILLASALVTPQPGGDCYELTKMSRHAPENFVRLLGTTVSPSCAFNLNSLKSKIHINHYIKGGACLMFGWVVRNDRTGG